MKITVIARCYNEIRNLDRFIRGYSFADEIIISDGGSNDGSIDAIKSYQHVKLIHFDLVEEINGHRWNPDNPHLNYIINAGKKDNPDYLILDDMDCVPNYLLRKNARDILEYANNSQVNVFRLYMWGETQYYPKMNNYFDLNYTSLWAWKPKELNIYADETIRHGTFKGLSESPLKMATPNCLLHKSWLPETIESKVKKYNEINLPTNHPKEYAGDLQPLPEWAKE